MDQPAIEREFKMTTRSFPKRPAILLWAVVAVSTIVCSKSLSAQVPEEQPARGVLNLPEGVDPQPAPVVPQAATGPQRDQLDSISRRIQGLPESGEQAPLPEGLRELMGRQPSVLKGSSLDPELEFLPESPQGFPAGLGKTSLPKRARAAEMLLKTARLLDKLEPASENHSKLVDQMRREAARLLAEPSRVGKPLTGKHLSSPAVSRPLDSVLPTRSLVPTDLAAPAVADKLQP